MRAFLDVGDYYAVDLSQNATAGRFVDPEQFGRELGVLSKGETVS